MYNHMRARSGALFGHRHIHKNSNTLGFLTEASTIRLEAWFDSINRPEAPQFAFSIKQVFSKIDLSSTIYGSRDESIHARSGALFGIGISPQNSNTLTEASTIRLEAWFDSINHPEAPQFAFSIKQVFSKIDLSSTIYGSRERTNQSMPDQVHCLV